MSSVEQPAAGSAGSTRPRHEQWEALVILFGEPHIQETRGRYNKVAADLKNAHYTEAQILRAGKLYQRDHGDWAFTPMSLLKHIDQLLHIDRSPPAARPGTSSVSEEDDRPGISFLEYAMSEQGKQDPNLSEETKMILRRTWQQSKRRNGHNHHS